MPISIQLSAIGTLLVAAIAGIYFLGGYVEKPWLRNGGYGICLLTGAIAFGLLLLRLDELRQLRRWKAWKCPNCGKPYQVKRFLDVRFWGTKEKGAREGVLLRCANCEKETAFNDTGTVQSRSSE